VEPLWPFVAGEFAFECVAWSALEFFLVDQVVAWMKKELEGAFQGDGAS
jgi:hypothetical protein